MLEPGLTEIMLLMRISALRGHHPVLFTSWASSGLTCREWLQWDGRSVQFSSVAQSWPTLCDPMNRSTPGLPVRHHLPEFTQTHPLSQ